MSGKTQTPMQNTYDVVIIGGAIMGASTAWFLSDNKDFNGSVLVVERDTTYETFSTSVREAGDLSAGVDDTMADAGAGRHRHAGACERHGRRLHFMRRIGRQNISR